MSFVVVFNLILTVLTAITGSGWLLERLWLAKRRPAEAKPGAILEFCVSLFPVIFAVFVLRSFVVEPFRIPSGSMIPTLHVGDFILVNKYDYGLRCPVGECKLLGIGEPQRGDVVVFKFPDNPSVDFIKRVVGVPGDHIRYADKILSVNGEVVATEADGIDVEDGGAQRLTENLAGVKHSILLVPGQPSRDVDEVVPPGHYFMMGDNRDGSNDSRYWGFVPEENLKGKAILIWMSWESGPVFSRFGKLIR